jgi:hypothetical protein
LLVLEPHDFSGLLLRARQLRCWRLPYRSGCLPYRSGCLPYRTRCWRIVGRRRRRLRLRSRKRRRRCLIKGSQLGAITSRHSYGDKPSNDDEQPPHKANVTGSWSARKFVKTPQRTSAGWLQMPRQRYGSIYYLCRWSRPFGRLPGALIGISPPQLGGINPILPLKRTDSPQFRVHEHGL